MSKLDVRLHRINSFRNEGYWKGSGRVDSGMGTRLDSYFFPEYWTSRIFAELTFGQKLSAILDGKYDDILLEAADSIVEAIETVGTVSPEVAQAAEKKIAVMSGDAKKYTLLAIAHAHIDMNWQWRFDETVAITLDTFATMLKLMDEYPQFTFSQSQASTYQIVEQYGPPHMLERIAQRAQEGRWESSAATWVEADKNTPNGESMARHLLYTKRYISKLLGIPAESMELDFEPDTFGHSENVPEILNKGGVKYYYHVRGSVDPQLVWWKAPSGAKVLSFRDCMGYSAVVDETFACQMLDPCKELGIDTMIRLYGVGDHGGGPSRRDIGRIMDMMNWPVYPTIRFGTYHEFFHIIEEKFGDRLPVREGEMNFVFTGCYTTQTRIKKANRIGEATLNESELFSTFANLEAGTPYPAVQFEDSWEKILFNQFHDILTGSGVIDTREFALGQFQQTMAQANTQKLTAIRAIADKIDTSAYITDEDPTKFRTEGAGVGNGVEDFLISQVDRGEGSIRVYNFFNAAPFDRKELVTLTVWDWPNQDFSVMEFRNEKDEKVPFQLLKGGTEWYWFHEYVRVVIPVEVPAMGYATYTLRRSDDCLMTEVHGKDGADDQLERPHEFVLENDFLRVELDKQSGIVMSMVDKKTGEDLVDPQWGMGIFRLINEDTDRGMTSWRVGRHMGIKDFDQDVKVKMVQYQGARLRQSVTLETVFGRSKLKATVSLDADKPVLNYDVECDWHEIGKPETGVPQLNFFAPVAYSTSGYRYDVPCGLLDRPEMDQDLPGNSFILALPEEGTRGVMLSADTKYGFRGYEDSVAVDLIRASYEPDPYPEYGIHKIRLALAVVDVDKPRQLIETAYALWHPINSVTSPAHKGTLPLNGSFLRLVEGNAAVQAVKMPEEGGSSMILRLYETDGVCGKVSFKLWKAPAAVSVVDINEKPACGCTCAQGDVLTVEMPAHQVVTVKVDF